jgi:hypothetical protein
VSVPAFGCGLHSMTREKSATPLRKEIREAMEKKSPGKKNLGASKKTFLRKIFLCENAE